MHLDCLAPEVYEWLLAATPANEFIFRKEKYRVWRTQLNQFINPFAWLSEQIGSSSLDFKKHALVLVTRPLAGGKNGVHAFRQRFGPSGQ